MPDAKTIPKSPLLTIANLAVAVAWYAAIWGIGTAFLVWVTGGQSEPVVSIPVDIAIHLTEPHEMIPGSFVTQDGESVDWVNLKASGQINVRPSELSGLPQWLMGAQVMIAVAGLLLFLYQLRRLMFNATRGDYFTAANAWHIRCLGILLIAYPVVVKILVWFWTRIYHFPATGNTGFQLMLLPNNTLLAGLLLLVLSEVFRVGVQMREDQELTI